MLRASALNDFSRHRGGYLKMPEGASKTAVLQTNPPNRLAGAVVHAMKRSEHAG